LVTETKEKKSPTTSSVVSPLIEALLSNKRISQEELDSLLEATCKRALKAVHGVAITIYLLGSDDLIHYGYVYYTPEIDHFGKNFKKLAERTETKLKSLCLKKEQGIVGKCISEKRSILTVDAQNDPDFNPKVDQYTGFITYSMLTAPLISNKVIGAIQVINRIPQSGRDRFDENDLELLQEVAEYAARIIKAASNSEETLTDFEAGKLLAKLSNTEFINLNSETNYDAKLVERIGENILKKLNIFPLKQKMNGSLTIVVSDPLDYRLLDKFRFATGYEISKVYVATEKSISNFLSSVFKGDFEISETVAEVGKEYESRAESIKIRSDVNESSAPIVQLATRIIEDAYLKEASDIHIEPFENEVRVRYRIDGILHKIFSLPPATINALISRLKIMAELDISERRLPQDGRIKFVNYSTSNIDIDLRVSTGPMAYGEKVVMRILDKTSAAVPLEAMGYSPYNLKIYRETIAKPYGMILHCGPTGSGKTTALYAALNCINKPDINIQTAEDPIEYMLAGINQMQMHPDIGLNFATALRCYLRQDPDVIMVGEIRDLETAEIAIEAALTGHLMFSTLHTNDAPGTITRFVDMGIQPFLISSSLLMVVAQRLVRRLCKCKEEYTPSYEELELLGIEDKNTKLYRAKGCSLCNNTGYKGRIGVHELLILTDNLKPMIDRRASSDEIRNQAIKDGMITLFEDGAEKVHQGITSLEELLRVVKPN